VISAPINPITHITVIEVGRFTFSVAKYSFYKIVTDVSKVYRTVLFRPICYIIRFTISEPFRNY
jgi:hypothetical protein